MNKIKLTKASTNNLIGSLRTNEVIGIMAAEPEIGRSFVMYADPLTENTDVRIIQTSLVTDLTKEENRVIMKTENSIYVIEEVLEEKA